MLTEQLNLFKGESVKKVVDFDVPGQAKHDQATMRKQIKEIARRIYDVDVDIASIDLTSYYRPDGAKITKTLTSLLRKTLTKEQVQERFAGFGKDVSDLYTVGASFQATFGDKRLLGEGVYESGKTCFRSDGENAISKKFLEKYRRCMVIVLYMNGKKDPVGRCIAYIAGNRNIYLTNFYWKNITPNKLYMITAVRHLFGLKKVLFRYNPKFYLPIYRNGDSIHVYDQKTKLLTIGRLAPCPHCSKKVPAHKLYSEEINSYRLIGCTEECAKKHSAHHKLCAGCKKYAYVGDMAEFDKKRYCRACQDEMLTRCSCGNMFRNTKDERHRLCLNCRKNVRVCTVCEKTLNPMTGRVIEYTSGKSCCIECLGETGFLCSICRSRTSKEMKPVVINNEKIFICEDCKEPLPGTIAVAS